MVKVYRDIFGPAIVHGHSTIAELSCELPDPSQKNV